MIALILFGCVIYQFLYLLHCECDLKVELENIRIVLSATIFELGFGSKVILLISSLCYCSVVLTLLVHRVPWLNPLLLSSLCPHCHPVVSSWDRLWIAFTAVFLTVSYPGQSTLRVPGLF